MVRLENNLPVDNQAAQGVGKVTKTGLITIFKAMAVEERDNRIRPITLYPEAVHPFHLDTDTVQADFDRSGILTPETVAQTVLYTVSLPSHAVIEDVTIMSSAGAL